MEHIVMFSGGVSSYYTAKLVVEKYGRKNCRLLFTDTLIEDRSLYEFNLQALHLLFGVPVSSLINACKQLPEVEVNLSLRQKMLRILAERVNTQTEKFIWLQDGRSPWEVFEAVRFIGSSRLAPCSHILKQKVALRFLQQFYSPDKVTLYLGIHWSERDRLYGNKQKKGAKEHWLPWNVESPLCDLYEVTPEQMMNQIVRDGLVIPVLYQLGFSHNNCGVFVFERGNVNLSNCCNIFLFDMSIMQSKKFDYRKLSTQILLF